MEDENGNPRTELKSIGLTQDDKPVSDAYNILTYLDHQGNYCYRDGQFNEKFIIQDIGKTKENKFAKSIRVILDKLTQLIPEKLKL